MKKRITYEIHGQIERNSYFRIGKALVRIEFTGGSINSTGVYPAQYVTENALFQKAIENSDAFRNGEIKRGRVEVIHDERDVVEQVENGSLSQDDALNTFPEVTNMQQARMVLMGEPYCCTLAELQNKSQIKAVALVKGVAFPNWL
ncbi:MAG: hypothetical protein J6V20_07515 [Bacteroidaceae bacterium]|nr:hypothetical protein [Bacteroidaceae bacterium]